jgi:hypothetical protein
VTEPPPRAARLVILSPNVLVTAPRVTQKA